MMVKMFILLCSRSMLVAHCVLEGAMYQPLFVADRFDRGRGGNVLLSPPPISPIATPTEEQEEHENNKNEVHSFLQNI